MSLKIGTTVGTNGGRLAYDKQERERVQAGLKEAAKSVVQSYTGGSSKMENVGGKFVAAGVGAGTSAKAENIAYKAVIKAAEGRVAKVAAKEATTKVVTKAALKGAAKGIGGVGIVPDLITAAKGYYRGYSSYGR